MWLSLKTMPGAGELIAFGVVENSFSLHVARSSVAAGS
jgi:hypothetical protein